MPEQRPSSGPVTEPQEPVVNVAAATTTPPASESQVTTQEQEVTQPSVLSEEQIGELLQSKQARAAMFRQAQSMKDKMFHQERLKHQQEEERQRVEGMDDEEFGQYTRAEGERQQSLQAATTGAMTRVFGQMQQSALAQISNKQVRDEVAAKANRNEYTTFPEFFAACVQAELGHKLKNQMTRKEKELREAITKELQADQVGEMAPQLGQGLPVARMSELHGIDLLSEGFGEALEKAKQG